MSGRVTVEIACFITNGGNQLLLFNDSTPQNPKWRVPSGLPDGMPCLEAAKRIYAEFVGIEPVRAHMCVIEDIPGAGKLLLGYALEYMERGALRSGKAHDWFNFDALPVEIDKSQKNIIQAFIFGDEYVIASPEPAV